MEESTGWIIVCLLYICCIVVLTVFFVIGFRKKWHRFRETTATHLVWSPLVVWYVLLGYRIVTALLSLVCWVWALVSEEGDSWEFFQYYAVWNGVLLIFYFTFLSAIQVIHNQVGISDPAVLIVGNLAVVFFNILAAAANLGFLLGLTVLLPLQTYGGDETLTMPSYSYFLSIFTAIFMFVEFILNNVPITPFLSTLMVFWAVIYSVFCWIVYYTTDEWVYPFLDVSNNWAVFAYFGLLMAHLIVFGITYLLWKVKQKLLRKFKPGFDATFEEVNPNLFVDEEKEPLRRYVSRDEDYYSETQPIKDRLDY